MKFFTTTFCLLYCALFSVSTAFAAPQTVHYQAKLTTVDDVAVLNGDYHVSFSLYTQEIGGVPVWTETYTSGNRINIVDGLLQLDLGSVTPLETVDFTQQLYLGVQIGGRSATPVWDIEMMPRRTVGAAVFAFEADRLDGFESDDFVKSTEESAIQVTSDDAALTINQDGAGDVLQVSTAAANALTVTADGNVQVGDSTSTELFSAGSFFTVSRTGTLVSSLLHASDGNSDDPAFAFMGATDTGMFRKPNGSIGFSVDGQEAATITDDGDLELMGSLVDGNGRTGGADQVLRANNGGLQWVDPSALGIGATEFVGLTDTPSFLTPNSLLVANATGDSLVTANQLSFMDGNLGVGTSSPASTLSLVTNNPDINLLDTSSQNQAAIELGDNNLLFANDKQAVGENPGMAFFVAGNGVGRFTSGGLLLNKLRVTDDAIRRLDTYTARSIMEIVGEMHGSAEVVDNGQAAGLTLKDENNNKGHITLTNTGNFQLISQSGEVISVDSDGNRTVISPHNFSPLPQGPSEEMAWSFNSQRDGRYIATDMTRVVRLVEQLTGEKLVHTGSAVSYDDTKDVLYIDDGSSSVLSPIKIVNPDMDITALTIGSYGQVGVGVGSPTAQLHTAGTVRLAGLGGGTLMTDRLGNVITTADDRERSITGTYTSNLDQLLSIKPVTYRWLDETGYDTEQTYVGFSAQNIAAAAPEIVQTNDEGFSSFSDRSLLSIVVNAIQEMWSAVRGIDTRVAKLEAENDQLRTQLGNIERQLDSTSVVPATPDPQPSRPLLPTPVDTVADDVTGSPAEPTTTTDTTSTTTAVTEAVVSVPEVEIPVVDSDIQEPAGVTPNTAESDTPAQTDTSDTEESEVVVTAPAVETIVDDEPDVSPVETPSIPSPVVSEIVSTP